MFYLKYVDLLKKVGFYHDPNRYFIFSSFYALYSIQSWLRVKHNCIVQVTADCYADGVNWNVQVLFYDPSDSTYLNDKSSGMYGDNGEFKTYEDALEFGILEALKRLC